MPVFSIRRHQPGYTPGSREQRRRTAPERWQVAWHWRTVAPAGQPVPIDPVPWLQLGRVGGHSAIDSLRRALPPELPPELRQNPPLHQIALLRHPDEPGIAILSVNGDGSLTLADNLETTTAIAWSPFAITLAARQPDARLAGGPRRQPSAAGFRLSVFLRERVLGFYGSDDATCAAFRRPSTAKRRLGAYGSGQIFSACRQEPAVAQCRPGPAASRKRPCFNPSREQVAAFLLRRLEETSTGCRLVGALK